MSKKKVLVIGANSFSGSHLVAEALRDGHQVWGVSRSKQIDKVHLPYLWKNNDGKTPLATEENFHFKSIDLNKELNQLIYLIKDVQPEIVINFAAQGMVAESWLNPTHWYQTNLVSQVALHDALRKEKCVEKYVHVTTPEVYGSTNGEWIKENDHFSPSTPYAVSRASCDMHLKSYFKAYNFPVVFTRAANVYGPGQQLYRIIPRTILSALTGKKMNLHGGGHSVRGFIHIHDAMRATLKLALKASPGSTWHLSTKDSLSIRELVGKICKLTGTEFQSIVNIGTERLGKDQSYLLDSSAIRNVHGWSDQISLDTGLNETIEWVKSNLKHLETMSWDYQHKP